MSSQTFHPWGFPRLPTEIRLQIWLLTLPGPRALNFLTVRPEPIIPDLVALKINYESREVVLRYYSFRNNLGELGNKYINFEIDSLHYQSTVTDIMNPLYISLLWYCYDERHSNAHPGTPEELLALERAQVEMEQVKTVTFGSLSFDNMLQKQY